ncbi:ABC-2 type transport system permease protein [Hymenobacter gelipurpurascens]|uniref:ABC-2 type transport system permease protein n=1 Tax=Hymenobacter gelipurpurascens TaxID=89968 RepID=A0A212TNT9_9BACT|nr:ABC transporter permease [Hymenobacter gelipurpurascens]SNC67653.1 ABC-2 type transport system permease protein [Hymenobacter gelipurpurascens]
MDKIILIFQREYLTRVRKKSFIIMSLIGPLLTVALFAVPVLIAKMSDGGKVVAVADAGGMFAEKLPEDKEDIRFTRVSSDLPTAKAEFQKAKYDALLYVPKLDLANPNGFQVFSRKGLGLSLERDIKRAVDNAVETKRLSEAGIKRAVLDNMKSNVDLQTVSLSDDGERSSSTGISTGVAYFCGFLIYMFIFIYGIQIMRGVMEEKTNRIVEVVISSVKPFQMMMGKVLGIAAVGFTQLGLWVLLSIGISSAMAGSMSPDAIVQNRVERVNTASGASATQVKETKEEGNKIMQAFKQADLNVPLLVGCFLFYFLGGYLFYGALFGAIGSAVDSETDTQQFMLPVTMPLVLTFVVSQAILTTNPNGSVAFWMSMIPFTSPIAMMMRLPFGGVPMWQLGLSMLFLVIGFVGAIWLAARIYRVGILMYGKKVTYGELSKWMFYKG